MQHVVRPLHKRASQQGLPGLQITKDVHQIDNAVPDVDVWMLAVFKFGGFVFQRNQVEVGLRGIGLSGEDDSASGHASHVSVVMFVHRHVLLVEALCILDSKDQVDRGLFLRDFQSRQGLTFFNSCLR